jgi:hypothetical protein
MAFDPNHLLPACRYGNWDELKLLLSRHMQCSDNVLLLGPGNCTLHEQLYDWWVILGLLGPPGDAIWRCTWLPCVAMYDLMGLTGWR